MTTALVRDRIQEMVAEAISRARQEGAIKLESMPDILVERPGNPDHGDFATSLPLRLARATRINPLQLAQTLVEFIPESAEINKVEAAHPGFINFYLDDAWVQSQVEQVRQAGGVYGNIPTGDGRPVMVEFVSVNPTGPVHVGHTRGAVLGSALATPGDAAGYTSLRNITSNAAGAPLSTFGWGLKSLYRSFYGLYARPKGETSTFPPTVTLAIISTTLAGK